MVVAVPSSEDEDARRLKEKEDMQLAVSSEYMSSEYTGIYKTSMLS